jgi:hypothetical protein
MQIFSTFLGWLERNDSIDADQWIPTQRQRAIALMNHSRWRFQTPRFAPQMQKRVILN